MARKPKVPQAEVLAMLNANEPKPEEKKADAPTQAELVARLTKLEADNAELVKSNANYQASQAALLATPSYQTPQLLPEDVDMKGLPDPTEDSVKYAEELAKRFKTAYGNARHNESIQQTEFQSLRSKQDLLWNDFSSEYKDYTTDAQKISIAAEQVAKMAKARDMDVNKYMYGAGQKQFMLDVTTAYDKLFGKPKAPLGVDPDDEEDGEEDIRTAGVFGGQESGGKSQRGKEPGADAGNQPGGFTKAIRDWQIKNGYYR